MIAAGTVEYTLGTLPVTGRGISWASGELGTALSAEVADVVYDVAGNADLTALLAGVPDTEFDQTEVKKLLEASSTPENWRVGEAIAETYLTHHRTCHFPWPDGRDARKSGSSLPGADLVGFQRDGAADRFAFGEVKTSGETKYPPGAMHGRTGLKQQLEDLRDKVAIRDTLVKYLWYRALNAPWKDRFVGAYTRYNADNTDVRIFGLMIRDVPPHEDDLRARVTKLGRDCPPATVIELIAIYLTAESISVLSEKVVNSRNEGDV